MSAADLLSAEDVPGCDCYVVDQEASATSALNLIAQLRDRHFTAPAILIASQPSRSLREQAKKSRCLDRRKTSGGEWAVRQDTRCGRWARLAMCRRVLHCLVAMITMSVAAPVFAQKATPPAGRGELLLTRNCARCHAVGRTGASPHPAAPPFRTLSRKYKIEGLAVRGYVSGAGLLSAGDLTRCDCYVVDQKISALSGLDLIAQLRDRHFTAPAILIASHPSRSLREQAKKADVSIVEKPLVGNGLLDRTRDVVGGRG